SAGAFRVSIFESRFSSFQFPVSIFYFRFSIFHFRVSNMATRFDKFTVKAQEALQGTQDVASRFGNQQLEPLHLLLALIDQKEGIVPSLLARLGVPPPSVAKEAEQAIEN